MKTAKIGWPIIAAALLLLFVAAVIVLLHLLPHPLSPADYFVAGSVATLIVMLALFLILLLMWLASGKGFFRRRNR